MAINCRLIICTLFCSLLITTSVQAQKSCETMLGSSKINSTKNSVLNKSLQRLKLIDPIFYAEVLSHPNLSEEVMYLILKQRAWKVLPYGMLDWKNKFLVSAELRSLWINNFGNSYKIEDLKPDQLSIFYANYLQSIYLKLAQTLKTDFVDSLVLDQSQANHSSELLGRVEKYMVFDLRQSHLDPVYAHEALAKLNQLKALKAGAVEVLLNLEFDSNHNQYMSKEICCKNRPGCTFCPNNLGFLNL